MEKEVNCSICLVRIRDDRKSCSAVPINDGRCCLACDNLIVTPVRIARASGMTIEDAVIEGVAMHAQINAIRKELINAKGVGHTQAARA